MEEQRQRKDLSEIDLVKKSVKKNILRPFSIQKVIFNQVMRIKNNVRIMPAQGLDEEENKDEVEKLRNDFERWLEAIQSTEEEKLVFDPFLTMEDQAIEFRIEKAVEDVIIPLIKTFIATDENSD